MNSTRPGRSRSSSSGWGSLTLRTSSARAHTSSASATTSAPAAAVVVVGDRRARAGAAARPARARRATELVHAVGRDRDAVLAVLELTRDPDCERRHRTSSRPLSGVTSGNVPRTDAEPQRRARRGLSGEVTTSKPSATSRCRGCVRGAGRCRSGCSATTSGKPSSAAAESRTALMVPRPASATSTTRSGASSVRRGRRCRRRRDRGARAADPFDEADRGRRRPARSRRARSAIVNAGAPELARGHGRCPREPVRRGAGGHTAVGVLAGGGGEHLGVA